MVYTQRRTWSNEKLLPSRNELTLKDLASYFQCLILDWIDHTGWLGIAIGKIRYRIQLRCTGNPIVSFSSETGVNPTMSRACCHR